VIVGVPREIKENEYRVAMVPSGVEALIASGHKVLVERGAGLGSGISDGEYRRAGASLAGTGAQVYKAAEMIVKVKEPLPAEFARLREGQVVFTYFHFAADKKLTAAMLGRRIAAVAYETVEEGGTLPLLTPMSEIAGRMAVQEGAKYLERPMMGRGVLLGGVPGVAPCEVVIVGGGVVGANAAKMASGLGAKVTILDVNLDRLRYLDDIMPKNVTMLVSNAHTLRDLVERADLLIGAVLVKGARAPVLVTREMVKRMKQGAVVVDVAVDQGGCIETCRPTTHAKPTFVCGGVVHYCVTNMPGAVGRTSTFALTNATFPYALKIAENGIVEAVRRFPPIAAGLSMYCGRVTCKAVAETFGLEYVPPLAAIEA